jgi:tryptophanyl-tRNA synthetase
VQDLKLRYRAGKVGDVEVKQKLARALNAFLDPLRERRARYAAEPSQVEEILQEGTRRMRREAQATMGLVRQAMGLVRDLKV